MAGGREPFLLRTGVIVVILLALAGAAFGVTYAVTKDDSSEATDDETDDDGEIDPDIAAAQAQLDAWVEEGEAVIENDLIDEWVPQVASKIEGIELDGETWDLGDIVDEHQALRDEFSAVLLYSGDYVYDDDELWVSIVPEPFATPQEALQWCVDHGRGNDICYAKFITHDESVEITEAFQN